LRLLQAAWDVFQGRRDGLPLAHEEKELLQDKSLTGGDAADRPS
jgi:hypothetical protein